MAGNNGHVIWQITSIDVRFFPLIVAKEIHYGEESWSNYVCLGGLGH